MSAIAKFSLLRNRVQHSKTNHVLLPELLHGDSGTVWFIIRRPSTVPSKNDDGICNDHRGMMLKSNDCAFKAANQSLRVATWLCDMRIAVEEQIQILFMPRLPSRTLHTSAIPNSTRHFFPETCPLYRDSESLP